MLVGGFVVVNKVIGLTIRTRNICLIFKVDFKKAYDSINLLFLDYMLIIFDFNDIRRSWIEACVFARNIDVLVNDSPT